MKKKIDELMIIDRDIDIDDESEKEEGYPVGLSQRTILYPMLRSVCRKNKKP